MMFAYKSVTYPPSVTECSAMAECYIKMGFSQLFFHHPGPNQRQFIQFYRQSVLPQLRQKYGGAQVGQEQAA
jgi:hypothetical protein